MAMKEHSLSINSRVRSSSRIPTTVAGLPRDDIHSDRIMSRIQPRIWRRRAFRVISDSRLASFSLPARVNANRVVRTLKRNREVRTSVENLASRPTRCQLVAFLALVRDCIRRTCQAGFLSSLWRTCPQPGNGGRPFTCTLRTCQSRLLLRKK